MTYRDLVGIPDPSKANVNSLAVDDPDAAALAIHSASTAAHGLGATWQEKYVARGLSRSGITVGQAGVFFEEFTDVARWQETLGGGTRLALANVLGGVVQIDVAAGPNGETNMPGSLAYGNPTAIHGGQRWYVAARMRMVLLPPAGGQMVIGAADNAGGAQLTIMGYYGAMSLTNFGFGSVGPGAPGIVLSTVVLDNAWHDFEHWHDGTTFYGSIDGETPVSYVMAAPPTTMMNPFFMAVSTGVAGVTMDIDKALWVFPQAA